MAKCKISFDHFTREQIEELSVQLAVLSKRDTEFPDASALTGEEKLAIVQNGANALASMSAVANVVLQKLLEQVYPGHLDDLGVYVNTTEYWDSQAGFRPDAGTIIIYTDRDTISGKNVSGIKIGDGTTTVQSLPFTDDKIALDLLLHKSNDTIHITAEERASWNAKSDFSGNYNDLTNKPHVPKYLYELLTDASHRTVSDSEKAYWNSKYEKPNTGIPKTDLSAEAQDALYKADNAVLYTEQALGESQKSQARTNIGAGTYSKPATGIPASDIEEGVIPDVSGFVTKTVNDLVNYYTKGETYNRTEINQLISTIQGFSYEVVDNLPIASADTMGKIYLAPSADPQTQNIKDEYITIDNGEQAETRYTWEQIGSTAIDLEGYVTTEQLSTALADYTTTSDLTTLLSNKQDTISDLDTIRSGASAGATAYQKPSGGIPSTDLASGVIPTVNNATLTVKMNNASKGTFTANASSNVEIDLGTVITSHQDISGKADKVSNATSGNFAGLDSNGNLVDSGHKHSDYLTSHQDISGKEDTSNKVSSWSSTTTDTHYPSEKLTKDSLDAKQDQLYYDNIVGRMYRNNVSGGGSISINGTSGQFPTVTTAGTYTVEVKMTSATASYGLNVTFGSNTYNLTTTNGTITDSRELTIAANSTWSAAVVGSVANGTIIEVRIISAAVKVTEVGKVAVSNSYNDLFDKPNIPSTSGLESTSNKVSTITGYETSTSKYPNTKAVYDAIAALPSPMVFQGTIGTSGTSTTVPSNPTEGDTYKIIEGGTSLSFPGISDTIKVGDTVVYKNSTIGWVLIPSGDEPSGTVTSVTIKGTSPIVLDSESAISTSGTRTVSHADSGVTAGTYKSVTVDAKGHVTAGSNPTTLGGYGITDANINNGVITLGGNTITPLTQHQDISGKQDTPLETTWSALKSLRDGGTLEAGRKYRITDYVATTVQTDSRSANHPFDIIVEAISTTALSEEARAALHSGDTYFATSKLDAWSIWYCLDNDTTRFVWADTTNGKGVIYRMIDEYDNDVPYDFKGIQFKRYEITASTHSFLSPLIGLVIGRSGTTGITVNTSNFAWYYTFSRTGTSWSDEILDASLGKYTTKVVFAMRQWTDTIASTPRLLGNVFIYGPVVWDFLHTQAGQSGTYSPLTYFSGWRIDGPDCTNNTLVGWFGINSSEGPFRENLIVGGLRHSHTRTNFQYNIIFVPQDNSFLDFGQGCYGNVIAAKTFTGVTAGSYFYNNTINASDKIANTSFGEMFGINTLANIDKITNSFFGNYITNNTFTGIYFGSIKINGQFSDCTFTGKFIACSFEAICGYVDFVGGSGGSSCVGLDVVGSVRGTSSSRITVSSSNFLLANASGVNRRVRLEGCTDNSIVATWKGANGKPTGIRSTDNGSTWSSYDVVPDVSGFYTKPASGIPASDLESGVQMTLQDALAGPLDGDTLTRNVEDEICVKDGGITVAKLASAAQSRLIPSGGTSGYVLAKASGTDYDLEWVAQSGGSLTPMTNAEIDTAVNSAWV